MLNSPIAIVTDGIISKTHHVERGLPLFIDGDEVEELIDERVAIGFANSGENEFNTRSKKVIKDRNELIKIFEHANKLLRSEGIQSGRDRFCEFANILFLKLISEIDPSISGRNVIPKAYLWDSFKDKHGDELLSYVNDSVLTHFAKKYGGEIFKSMEIESPKTLKRIIDTLDPLSLVDVNSDVKGDAFEYFLRRYIGNHHNDLGEYFTPRHIVKACVKLANPKFGEKVYDPFCGTGGMLIEAFKHVKTKHMRLESKMSEHSLKTLKENSFFGNEITPNFRIARMNMILMGDGHSNIHKRDSLKELDKSKRFI